jgi:hypothetical protein
VIRNQEQQRAQNPETDRRGSAHPAADLVRQPAKEQQGAEIAQDIDGIDQGQREPAEAERLGVKRIERRR